MAPVLEEPRVTTIVLGPWGVSNNAPPAMVGSLYGEAIVRGRSVADSGEDEGQQSSQHVKLGHLYHEIHFALPPSDECDDKFFEAFREGLTKAGCKVTNIPALDGLIS